jgi:hypothetical protein
MRRNEMLRSLVQVASSDEIHCIMLRRIRRFATLVFSLSVVDILSCGYHTIFPW